MAATVKYLHKIDGRWKYRRAIPPRLRPHIDGNITEFVRWLGAGRGKQPSPEILRRFVEADTECAALVAIAEKRESGTFDELPNEVITHFIDTARSELLEEDEEARFDEAEDAFFESQRQRLEGLPGVTVNTDPDRRWSKRQYYLLSMLEVWRADRARGKISEDLRDDLLDRAVAYGLNLDPESSGFRRLAKQYQDLLVEVTEASLKRQAGDLVPTPEAPPPLETPMGTPKAPDQTITGLVEEWWKEARAAGRTVSTFEAYSRAARQLSEFLEHDDANAVTKKNVVAFKDHRLAEGRSLKTIKDGDLAALKSLFEWGVANGRVTTNPAKEVKIIPPKRVFTRSKGFTATEAEAILRHSAGHIKSPREAEKTASAKRWVPWLCAYTGARVGEMAQLRRQDLRQEGDLWVLSLTPEAGTIKGKQFRDIPLHPHLLEQGFVEFVKASEEGFLFMKPLGESDQDTRGAWRTTKNRLTEFVRKVVTDRGVQPNHGWRHRFETLARELGLREDVTNAITGHTTQGVAANYGNVTLAAKAAAIERMPRIDVGPLEVER